MFCFFGEEGLVNGKLCDIVRGCMYIQCVSSQNISSVMSTHLKLFTCYLTVLVG